LNDPCLTANRCLNGISCGLDQKCGGNDALVVGGWNSDGSGINSTQVKLTCISGSAVVDESGIVRCSSPMHKKGVKIGSIVGGTVGGIAIVLAVILWLCCRPSPRPIPIPPIPPPVPDDENRQPSSVSGHGRPQFLPLDTFAAILGGEEVF